VAESRGRRVLDLVRWGLVPSWAKNISVGDKMINARADRLLSSNAYKRPFERRRCILPADGFYEWQTIEGRKVRQPWFIRRRDREPLAFAGLWSVWHDRALGDDAPRVRSCTIITTEPNDVMRDIHDRMPVILPESAWDTWLDPENNDVEALGKLLVPLASEELELWPVTTLVNKPDNNSPKLLEPAPVNSAS
jgi:putative SOS response-associated peptidase YedK